MASELRAVPEESESAAVSVALQSSNESLSKDIENMAALLSDNTIGFLGNSKFHTHIKR